MSNLPLPPVVDAQTWQRQLDELRVREKAATRELDAIAAQRRRLPMVKIGEEWQCPGCTGFTSEFTRLEFLEDYDARFVVITQGPIDEALAYKRKVGNTMTWYSTANSPFGTEVGAPPDGGYAVNVFLRDGDTVYRTWHSDGRGTEQLSYSFGLIDLLPYGRREDWQDSPAGWPREPAGNRWATSEAIAALYGPQA